MLIEINLAPGASGARARGGALTGIRLPALPAMKGDIKVVGGAVGAVLVVALVVFGLWRMDARETSLEARVQQEVADSIRYASTIELVRSLQARQDTVRERIDIIRRVDARRYVWPHLLDEISLSIPPYIWLTEIGSTAAVDSLAVGPNFTLQGYAGSTQSLTRLMKNLEESSFVQGVTLITSEQDLMDGRTVQRFSLEARYQSPNATVIETVPIVALN